MTVAGSRALRKTRGERRRRSTDGRQPAAPRKRERSTDEETGSPVYSDARVPPPPSRGLRALATKLKEHEAERLVEKILAMIRDLPDYQGLTDESFWTEVRQIIHVQVPVFYNACIEGRAASEGELSTARYFARRRVHQGITLRGQLTAYRNGMWILWEELVKATENHPGQQKELLLRAAWAFRHLDTVSEAVTEAYLAEQEGRARDRDRLLRHLFDELIDGGPSTRDELEARATTAGLQLDAAGFVVFVVTVDGPSTSDTSVLASLASPMAVAIAELSRVAPQEVVAVERNREVLIVAPVQLEDVPRKKLRAAIRDSSEAVLAGGHEVRVGISGVVSGLSGIREGHKEAHRAIEIGQTENRKDTILFYPDFVLDDVLDSVGRAGGRLVHQALGPLLDLGSSGRRYLETLDGYFRAGSNLKVAAGELGIHPNTLSYRMRQIHKLTGLDLGDPDQRLRVEVALRLLALERQKEGSMKKSHTQAGRVAGKRSQA